MELCDMEMVLCSKALRAFLNMTCRASRVSYRIPRPHSLRPNLVWPQSPEFEIARRKTFVQEKRYSIHISPLPKLLHLICGYPYLRFDLIREVCGLIERPRFVGLADMSFPISLPPSASEKLRRTSSGLRRA